MNSAMLDDTDEELFLFIASYPFSGVLSLPTTEPLIDVLPVIGLVLLLPLLEVGLGKDDLRLALDLMKDGCLLLEDGRPNVFEGQRHLA